MDPSNGDNRRVAEEQPRQRYPISEDEFFFIVGGYSRQIHDLMDTHRQLRQTIERLESVLEQKTNLAHRLSAECVARLEDQSQLRELLRRIVAWDQFDSASDGPFWRSEIRRLLFKPLNETEAACRHEAEAARWKARALSAELDRDIFNEQAANLSKALEKAIHEKNALLSG